MKLSSLRTPLTICLLLVAACGKETATESEVAIYDDEAIADESQTGNWLAYGRTHNERRFSPSEQIDTGEEAWKFYIVPGNPADGFEDAAMEMAAETWTGEWWKHGGGGNAWHSGHHGRTA
jgi:glucose dehydrogenase